MSRPLAIATVGLLMSLMVSAFSELPYSRGPYTKGAVLLAFLAGAAMVLGGLAVGLMRSIHGVRRRL